MSKTASINPYLIFNGNCREAMTFYKECLGAELQVMDFASAPIDVPAEAKNLVMHSMLTKDDITLMASDTMPGQDVTFGTNVSLSVSVASKEEADSYFEKLVQGGKTTMALQDTFWGAYFGMFTDKYGINWMISTEHNQ